SERAEEQRSRPAIAHDHAERIPRHPIVLLRVIAVLDAVRLELLALSGEVDGVLGVHPQLVPDRAVVADAAEQQPADPNALRARECRLAAPLEQLQGGAV